MKPADLIAGSIACVAAIPLALIAVAAIAWAGVVIAARVACAVVVIACIYVYSRVTGGVK